MASYTPNNPHGFTTRNGRPVSVSGPDEDGYLCGDVTNKSGRKVFRFWNAHNGHHSASVSRKREVFTDLVDAPIQAEPTA